MPNQAFIVALGTLSMLQFSSNDETDNNVGDRVFNAFALCVFPGPPDLVRRLPPLDDHLHFTGWIIWSLILTVVVVDICIAIINAERHRRVVDLNG
jgi:hypothetical protein